MTKVYNPTNTLLEVVIEGFPYSVEPYGESKSIDDRHAQHWKERIHEFIILRKEKDEEKSVTKTADVKVTKEPEAPKEPADAPLAKTVNVPEVATDKKEEVKVETVNVNTKTETKK